jgi:cytochrome c oxidase subunit 2
MEPSAQPSLLLPAQRSTFAPEVDALFHGLVIVSLLTFIGVTSIVLVSMVRNRGRRSIAVGTPERPDARALFWSFIPVAVLACMFVYGSATWRTMQHAPEDALVIRVRARQWAWEFEHPNGVVEDNEVHVPAGRPVRFEMTTSDVMHSLAIPDFRVRQAIIPGRTTSLWFEAVDPHTVPRDAPPDGFRVLYTAQIYCGELCGLSEWDPWRPQGGHATMYGLVHVQRAADYEWFPMGCSLGSSCPEGDCTPERMGEILFASKTCSSCHQVRPGAPSVAAPNLFGVADTERTLADGTRVFADGVYLRRAIRDPRAQLSEGFGPIMPRIRMSEDELDALIAYMRSLH